jgi:hypothetical protein
LASTGLNELIGEVKRGVGSYLLLGDRGYYSDAIRSAYARDNLIERFSRGPKQFVTSEPATRNRQS